MGELDRAPPAIAWPATGDPTGVARRLPADIGEVALQQVDLGVDIPAVKWLV
jgi:hypothetical protein